MTQTKDNGGPAFPMQTTVEVTDCDGNKHSATAQHAGMSLRDLFATQMDRDEYRDQAFRHLSQEAKTLLAGPRPEKPADNAARQDRVAWQLAEMKWELRVRAAVRFIYADAMIEARKGGAE